MSVWTLDPRLADCRRLFLAGYTPSVRIGIHDFELEAPQRLRFDVDLFVPLAHSTPRADRIDEVLDYDFIRRVIQARVARGHVSLQETLCDEIAAELLSHPQVRAVRVATAKPDVYPDSEAIGVEVFHIKSSEERGAR